MIASHIVLAVPFHQFEDRIKIVGGLWTYVEGLKGDIIVGLGGDLVEYLVEGDLVGVFRIGDADVTFFWGGEEEGGIWSRGLCPPSSARGPARSHPNIDSCL